MWRLHFLKGRRKHSCFCERTQNLEQKAELTNTADDHVCDTYNIETELQDLSSQLSQWAVMEKPDSVVAACGALNTIWMHHDYCTWLLPGVAVQLHGWRLVENGSFAWTNMAERKRCTTFSTLIHWQYKLFDLRLVGEQKIWSEMGTKVWSGRDSWKNLEKSSQACFHIRRKRTFVD